MPFFFKLGGLGLILTVMGLFMVKQDVRLRIWGEQAEGTIDGAWVNQGLRRGGDVVKVGYTYFHEKEGMLKCSFSPASGWKPPADLKVKVTFLPYDPHVCRTEFESSRWAYILTSVGFLMLGVSAWLLFNESVVDSQASASTVSTSNVRTFS